MTLSIFQQTNPVGAGNTLVAGIYKASAPSVLIAFYEFPGPYTGATQLHTFPGLANVVYNYVLYESPDHLADGTVRNSFSVQPNANAFNFRDPLYLEANTSPFFASGTNFYGQDSSLIGWNWYLEQVASGTQHYAEIWTKTIAGVPTTQDDTTADGWKLTQVGNIIAPDERWVIHFLPQLGAISSPASGTFISGTTLLTANTILDASAVGQAFILQGGGGYLNITLPDINTVPDNEPIFLNSNGGSHINAGITCFSGQFFQWFNNQSNLPSTYASSIYLGQEEDIFVYRFTFPGGAKRWIVCGDKSGMRMVGETIYDYSQLPFNTLFANGQYLSRTNYARLWAWVQATPNILIANSTFDNTSIIHGTSYFINHGKFSDGDGSTTFRLPILWQYGYQRAKSGVVGSHSNNGYPGDLDAQSVGTHTQPTHAFGAITGAGHNWFLSNSSGGRYSAGGGDTFGGKMDAIDTEMKTGYPDNTNIDGENLPTSTGIYALIRC
jgi:hypothetical protein